MLCSSAFMANEKNLCRRHTLNENRPRRQSTSCFRSTAWRRSGQPPACARSGSTARTWPSPPRIRRRLWVWAGAPRRSCSGKGCGNTGGLRARTTTRAATRSSPPRAHLRSASPSGIQPALALACGRVPLCRRSRSRSCARGKGPSLQTSRTVRSCGWSGSRRSFSTASAQRARPRRALLRFSVRSRKRPH